jgi:hypothetical protein
MIVILYLSEKEFFRFCVVKVRIPTIYYKCGISYSWQFLF